MRLIVKLMNGDEIAGDDATFEDAYAQATTDYPAMTPHEILTEMVNGVQSIVEPFSGGVSNLGTLFVTRDETIYHFNRDNVAYIAVEGLEEMLSKIAEAEAQLEEQTD